MSLKNIILKTICKYQNYSCNFALTSKEINLPTLYFSISYRKNKPYLLISLNLPVQ